MQHVAIDLNDSSLCIAHEGEPMFAGPGYAAVAQGVLHFGDEARPVVRLKPRSSHRRFWAGLSDTPLPQPLGDCASTADLVQRHLGELWSRCGGAEDAVLTVLPGWSPAQLGLLLGIADDIGMPVVGMADPAVAASRRPYPGRALWHLHATLDAAWISRIEQEGGVAALGARLQVERCGIEGLERGCAELLRRRFVECSRFDPLHDARSEQQLFEAMSGWLQSAHRAERVAMSLDHNGNRFEAWVDATQLRASIERICEPLTQNLRSLMSPREPSVLQVHGRLADYPGVLDALTRLPACTVVLLEPAAAARGALRIRPVTDRDAGVPLTRTLPWNQPAEESPSPAAAATGHAPTHIVYAGSAWRLGAQAVQIGTELGDGEYGIAVAGRIQAVSRRHCSIQLEDGRVMVHDQSRYGTLLNGHRIAGSAVLQAGDVLTLGQPPLEFALIAEVGGGA